MRNLLLPIIIAFCLVSCISDKAQPYNEITAGELIDMDSVAENMKQSRGQYDFSVSMLKNIGSSNGNIVCSPLGIEVLFDILKNGAKGDTYNELDSVLGIRGFEGCLVAKDMSSYSDNDGTVVSMANLLVGNDAYTLKRDYKEKIKTEYGAEVWAKDFASPSTTNEINAWIENKTGGLIGNAIDSLRPDTKICGVNTLYFVGKWDNAFEKSETRPTVFNNISGKKVKVDMMAKKIRLPYLKTQDFQLLSLPYKQREDSDAIMKKYSLYVFLPLPGKGFTPIMEYLENMDISKIRQEMNAYCGDTYPTVDVRLPKFETVTDIDVIALMEKLGVKTCFSPNADFGNISDDRIYIDQSRQKSIIKVDEEGTVAVAETQAQAIVLSSIVQFTKEAYFYADHPFIYMIVCEDLKTILFIGQYTDGRIYRNGEWVSDEDTKGAIELSFTDDKDFNPDDDPDRVYEVCDQMPTFPNGLEAFHEFLRSNTKYPAEAKENHTGGRVVVEFIIEKDGSISNIQVKKSVDPLLDEEAVRVIRSMPKWIPGKQNGETVRVRFLAPITFKLQQSKD